MHVDARHEHERDSATLVPIDQAARRLGIRASTIRYYEERGLLQPASRHAGRRWYDAAGLRRLAIIRYWQRSGLMRLDDIATILAGPDGTDRWRRLVDRQRSELAEQIERMEAARSFLGHVVTHHQDAPDGCPHYESAIWASSGAFEDRTEGR